LSLAIVIKIFQINCWTISLKSRHCAPPDENRKVLGTINYQDHEEKEEKEEEKRVSKRKGRPKQGPKSKKIFKNLEKKV
jgi:hypothetical protein